MNENQNNFGISESEELNSNDMAPETNASVESKADQLAKTIAEELAKSKAESVERASEETVETQPEPESEEVLDDPVAESDEETVEETTEETVEETEPAPVVTSVEQEVEKILKETEKTTPVSSYSSADDGREAMIRFQNVSMTYDNVSMALNNVSLQINEGEFVFIVGANGAGKTTLTKLLIREERVSSGRLFVNGFRLHKMRPWKVHKLRRTMGMVFQDFKLFDNMTVYENVAFAMRVVGAKPSLIRKRVPVFLEMVGIGHKSNAFPTELSGGEKQRVAFARAIVNNPDIVIADEPTGNIDTKMTEGIMELLLKINKLGKTVIVITHDAQIVQNYNKRVIKLENGQLVSDKIGGDF